MCRWQRPAVTVLLCSLGVACLPAVAAESQLTPSEQRGKVIFSTGESTSGAPISALVGGSTTPLPGSLLPCSGCHGADGYGRPEGGVDPPNITWASLTAPRGHDHDFGRKHPAFDEASVAAAVRDGLDPAGNSLDMAMPRYSMSDADMRDLVAYLGNIDSDLDPGITEDTVTVASLLPTEDEQTPVGQAMRRIMDAVFADVNEKGGIHGRRIEFHASGYARDPQTTIWQLRDLLEQGSVFALVGGYAAGLERELASIAEDLELPVIGPYTSLPRSGDTGERHTFYLTSGFIEQTRVLMRYALGAAKEGKARISIVYPAGALAEAAIDAAETQLGSLGADAPATISYTDGYFDAAAITDALVRSDPDAVLLLADSDVLARLASELGRRDLAPTLLLPGVFAGPSMLGLDRSFQGRVLLAYSTTPDDHTSAGIQTFEALHAHHGLGYEHSAAQISAFVAANVFVEALKRAGRDVSRERLFAALEGLSEFHSGLMPPLSFGPKSRIGAYGGYVVEVDRAEQRLVRRSEWITLRL